MPRRTELLPAGFRCGVLTVGRLSRRTVLLLLFRLLLIVLWGASLRLIDRAAGEERTAEEERTEGEDRTTGALLREGLLDPRELLDSPRVLWASAPLRIPAESAPTKNILSMLFIFIFLDLKEIFIKFNLFAGSA
jgi:hypothetical protein